MVSKNTKRVGASAAAITAAAIAAGYYFYASKNAKENRRIAAKWAQDLKSEVIREAKKAKDLNRAELLSIVDRAAAAYKTVRSIDPDDLKQAATELKKNWEKIAGETNSGLRASVKKGVRQTKKTVKRVKKTVRTAKSAPRTR